jgi:hypothetical protein
VQEIHTSTLLTNESTVLMMKSLVSFFRLENSFDDNNPLFTKWYSRQYGTGTNASTL